MPERIYIMTGPIQSGKTTKLVQWSANKKNVFGIFTPVIEGKRVFMDAHTKEQFRMEVESNEEDVFSIGRFVFSKRFFERAIIILTKAMREKSGWFVVDEIGPLELRGGGFDSIIKTILLSDTDLNILFVVRDSIIQRVKEHYNIKVSIITKDDTILKK